jgi:ketosteroid isomerase-like protein
MEVVMKIWTLSFVALFWSLNAIADTALSELGNRYFAAWEATQSPNATKEDVEHYLSFLKDDVAHQHLPYDSDDSRLPDGKESIRKGMLFYLGSHSAHKATLKQVIPAHNAVAITYTTSSKGVHPQTNELVELHYSTMEVLEIEDGKIAVIRKYEE